MSVETAPIRILCGLLALALIGCSASPEKRARVAEQEADRLPKTAESLAAFSRFELKPMTLSQEVSADKDKVAVSKSLDEKLRSTLAPLLDEWQKSKAADANQRVLLIQPEVASLRVISGGARFWAGAWTGESYIDMNLVLTDSATANIVGNVRIYRQAGAMAGAWSIGKSDKNLLDYMVDIARQYLIDNHGTAVAN